VIEPRTPEQKAETIAQWEAAGRSSAEAARRLEIPASTFKCRLQDARDLQLVRISTSRNADGDVTATHTTEKPDRGECVAEPLPGFAIARRTVHRVGGEVAQTWEREKPDGERTEAGVRAMFAAFAEPLLGLSPPIATPTHTDDNLLVVYPMGDPHFGMYAWGEEAGENFDLIEAERVTKAAVDRLVAMAPNARHATLLNLGDFYHSNDRNNATGKGTPVDVDGRFQKVMSVGAKALRWCVLRLLEKHEFVRVRNVKGNHDPDAHFALAMALEAYFENEPRVTIDMSPAAATYQRFGQVLIGETHGDTMKPDAMIAVMASDRPKDWGRTLHRYWLVGHVHHKSVKEYPGGTVETFRTLAAKDAWHESMGYRSGRDMNLIVYHRKFGEVGRSRCDISMLRAPA